MRFKTMKEFKLWLIQHEMFRFNGGSQGVCYKIGNKVYKIFNSFIEEDDDIFISYDKCQILQFSSISNGTYIFPQDVIVVSDVVVGYTMEYVNAQSLYKINPLYVNLNVFESALKASLDDILIISKNGVLSFDVTYNMLYGNDLIKVIDTLDYSITDIDSDKLYAVNKERFFHEIRLFLIDGYFDRFISSDIFLYSMYCDKELEFIDFLRLFRKKLSEYEGHEILKLCDAKKSVDMIKKRRLKYIRELDV